MTFLQITETVVYLVATFSIIFEFLSSSLFVVILTKQISSVICTLISFAHKTEIICDESSSCLDST